MKLSLLLTLCFVFANVSLLDRKKQRKQIRTTQRRKQPTPQTKFAENMFAKFKEDIKSGNFQGLIQKRMPSRDSQPARILKSRPIINNNLKTKIAAPKAIQYADWPQRFGGTSKLSSSRFGPSKPFMKDAKGFGQRSSLSTPAGMKTWPLKAKTTRVNNAARPTTWNQRTTTATPGVKQRFPLGSGAPKFGLKIAQPEWSKMVTSTRPTLKTTTSRRTTTTMIFNMCLNGGSYQVGVGCLCVSNFAGDFCDECVPGWNGAKCDNPQNLCSITATDIDCSSRWVFNLTLLELPTSAKTINMDFNGLIKSGAFRKKIQQLKDLEEISLKGNYFARFPLAMFKYQPFLKKLNVASNFLFALPDDIFYLSTNLEDLDMRNNNIKNIHPKSLEKNFELRIINFSNNNFENICRGVLAYQTKIEFVAFNRNDDLPLPLNKWFGECPYSAEDCELGYPQSQYGGPIINLRRRIGAFGENCN